MKLLVPEALWALLTLPAFALYLFGTRTAQKRGALLPLAGTSRRGSTSIPLVLFAAALLMAALALARPHAHLTVPAHAAQVVLALDASGSMTASDVEPTRFAAAKAAAKTFVRELPDTVRVGVVSFGDRAAPILEPTRRKAAVLDAIERLQPMRGTSIGSALAVAVATLYPDERIDPYALSYGIDAAWPGAWQEAEGRGRAAGTQPQPWRAVILVTDGQSTAGPHASAAAELAASLGARVYTIGIGTRAGQPLRLEGFTMRVRLDEPTLRMVAAATGGAYFHADAAAALSEIYGRLSERIGWEERYLDISALFALAAAVLAALCALLSVYWHKRVL